MSTPFAGVRMRGNPINEEGREPEQITPGMIRLLTSSHQSDYQSAHKPESLSLSTESLSLSVSQVDMVSLPCDDVDGMPLSL